MSRRAWPSPAGHRLWARAALAALALTAGAGCGSAQRASAPPARDSGLPAALVAGRRPIGRAPRFHLPATGPVLGACRTRLGPRFGVHLELFAENRVMLIPAGIGSRAPRRFAAGRIAAARCFGDLVT